MSVGSVANVIGQAALIVAALSKGPSASKEETESELYGWARWERAVTDKVHSAIGSVRSSTPLAALR